MEAKVIITKATKTLRNVEVKFSNGDYSYNERLTVKRVFEIIDEIRKSATVEIIYA